MIKETVIKHPEIFNTAKSLAPITAKEWELFENNFKEKSFSTLDTIQKPGSSSNLFYIIKSGIVRIYTFDQNGKEFTKNFRGVSGILGPLPEYQLKIPCRYYIQAVTASTVLEFDYDNFEHMMEEFPSWQILGRKIAENNYLEKEHREYMLTQLSTIQRWYEFQKIYGELSIQIPQYQVASYLGITPEAFCRLLKKEKTKE